MWAALHVRRKRGVTPEIEQQQSIHFDELQELKMN